MLCYHEMEPCQFHGCSDLIELQTENNEAALQQGGACIASQYSAIRKACYQYGQSIIRPLLRTDKSASSYNAGLGSDNELQGGVASTPELQAKASIGVQDCARGTAADGVNCDVPEELEAIIGELWCCLKRLYGMFVC